MKERLDFAVMRGDRRQNLLCDLLVADGHRAQLLPAPDKWQCENLLPPGAFLVTAKADGALREAAAAQGFRLVEYGSHPAFRQENGAITAEGAIQVAMRHRIRTIRGAEVLVIGYGAIGSCPGDRCCPAGRAALGTERGGLPPHIIPGSGRAGRGV